MRKDQFERIHETGETTEQKRRRLEFIELTEKLSELYRLIGEVLPDLVNHVVAFPPELYAVKIDGKVDHSVGWYHWGLGWFDLMIEQTQVYIRSDGLLVKLAWNATSTKHWTTVLDPLTLTSGQVQVMIDNLSRIAGKR